MKHSRFYLYALLTLIAVSAYAQPYNRTFVSRNGLDTNSCLPAAPCRTFDQALSQTTDGGEIVVLDSGGYSPGFTIMQSVSIESPTGVFAGMRVLSGNGININTSGIVKINGLTITGSGGVDGISITSAAAVYVENVSVSGFSAKGLRLTDNATLTVKNSAFRNNDGGIYTSVSGTAGGSARVGIDRVTLESHTAAGVAIGPNTNAVIRDSFSINTRYGYQTFGATTALSTIENSVAAHANHTDASGVVGSGGSTTRVSNCTIAHFPNGIQNSANSATLLTRGNNTIVSVANIFTGTVSGFGPN